MVVGTAAVDRRMTLRPTSICACLTLVVVAGCGGGSLTMTEYSEQGTAVVTVMEERIGSLDDELSTQAPTLEAAESYWTRRLQARTASLEGLEALEPPVALADLHDAGLDLYSRLIAAEEALALRVSSFESAVDPDEWWDTPDGEAVRAVDDEISVFCLEFQASYDATIDRLIASDVPWIPGEMKEVVRIDIGC